MKKDFEETLKDNPELATHVSLMKHENDLLKQQLETATTLNSNLQNQVALVTTSNENLQQQVDTLRFTLSKFNRQLFGKKNEQKPLNEVVHNLFNLNEAEANQNLNALEPTIEKVIKIRKTTSTLEQKLKNLESKEIIYDLSADEKTCEICQTPLVEIGSKTRETIEVLRKAIKVMEKTITYKCPTCFLFHKKDCPSLPIPGGIASPSLLAQVIVDKTANALPLYRQSEDYERIGLSLSRQTLSNWMIKSSNLIEIIYNHMKIDLLSKDIIHADETTVQVLKESGKAASTKSYMWTYTTGEYDVPIILYEYQSTRAGRNAQAFLKDFSGYLHVDGYAGYNQVENVTLVHCMAHLRRKFFDVYVSLPKEQQIKSLTTTALNYCQKIYDLDNASMLLSLEDRGIYKETHIKPLMIEFRDWLILKQLTSSTTSGYGKAINYGVNYISTIMNYLLDARLSLDNNRAERAIKPFVIGRKNWLFSNTPNGATSSALLYSITQTCLLNNLNPYKYYSHVLHVLANQTTKTLALDNLMPYHEDMITRFRMDKQAD